MHEHAIRMVGHVGAARAALFPPRGEHEVLHQELTAALEEIAERVLTRRRVEHVILLDAHPGERTPLAGYLIAQARELLFARQQLPALGLPLLLGYDGMVRKIWHDDSPLGLLQAKVPGIRCALN